ncbi:MAG: polysaccharide lyase family protein [Bacteroidota bacterium]
MKQVTTTTIKSKVASWLLSLCIAAGIFFSFAFSDADPKVTIKEDAETYTLDNGIVKVRISKVTGDLVSYRYKDMEMFETKLSPETIPQPQGIEPANNPNWKNPTIGTHQHGYWSHDVMGVKGSAPAIPSITIDPANNGGQIAEVSTKAISKGRKMGTGPGTAKDGDLTVDIEIRYTLERGASGVYTYCTFTHSEDYPQGGFGEARYCAKLGPQFDWISVADDVHQAYPKTFKGDKYVYTTNPTENRAFGWSSTTKKVGLFFINPSMEYMSGGPTKYELTGHLNTDAVAAPCVLNYWRSSHYGSAEANIAAGEKWEKTIGPFFIYANSASNPDAIYSDAKAQAVKEAGKWPYNWVEGVPYSKAKDRANVKGTLVLKDVKPLKGFKNFRIGLTAGEYVSPREKPEPKVITGWQRDGKFYQFWTKGNADGSFEIPNVRPGNYVLYAFTDGVLGEFVKSDIIVEKGKALNLGKLEWTPVRKGKQLWDIGIPNRNGSEFRGGNQRRDPEISLKYAQLFPDDITYTIGKSDFTNDWFYQHVPHNEDTAAKALPFYGVRTIGRATPFTVAFDMPAMPTGKAFLRFAICGTGTSTLDVEVNGQPAGKLEKLTGDGVITRHGESGLWYEKTLEFDASLMKKGANTLKLIVPQAPVNNGLVYDYIRLELEE